MQENLEPVCINTHIISSSVEDSESISEVRAHKSNWTRVCGREGERERERTKMSEEENTHTHTHWSPQPFLPPFLWLSVPPETDSWSNQSQLVSIHLNKKLHSLISGLNPCFLSHFFTVLPSLFFPPSPPPPPCLPHLAFSVIHYFLLCLSLTHPSSNLRCTKHQGQQSNRCGRRVNQVSNQLNVHAALEPLSLGLTLIWKFFL